MEPIIVWLRNDLRTRDNPALWHASKEGRPVIPIYILEDGMGGAQKVWLHHSLEALKKQIPLVLRKGDPAKILKALASQTGGDIYTNGDTTIADVTVFEPNLLVDPDEVLTKDGEYYKVFTPFWKASLKVLDPPKPLPVPKFKTVKVKSDALDDWKLIPDKAWARRIEEQWSVGEVAAQKRFDDFVKKKLSGYGSARDFPDRDGTSKLSPHLHFGEISVREIWHRLKGNRTATKFISELGWREFSYYLLHHFPKLRTKPFNPKFSKFEWDRVGKNFEAWKRGRTGYPIVDAGMRELWETGWMHNRVRMIVGSFLVKDLFLPWQKGAEWFWDTLVDADEANNFASWQWVAGCGADAAPYFRIFNPTLQAKRFDPKGEYIKKWVPELRDEDDVHSPRDPIVDHSEARDEAMRRFKRL